jgi:chromate transporter
MVAGTLGGLLTTWVTFTPWFLWIFLGAPFVEKLRENRALSAALSAITAAVVGVVLNLAIWFALHTLFREAQEVSMGPLRFDLPVPGSFDLAACILAAAALVAMFRFRLGAPVVLAACAAAGLISHTIFG